MRNLLARVPKAQQSRVATAIREVFVPPNHEKARDLWRTIAASAHNSLPKLAHAMEEAEYDVLPYMTFPKAHRTKLHSTDALDKPRVAGGTLPCRPYAGGIFGPPFRFRDRLAVGFSDQALTKRM